MKILDDFILGIPYLFLKKIPYAWLAAVFFWGEPPTLSLIFLAIVIMGLLMMTWQEHAWRRKLLREHQRADSKAYMDRPHLPRLIQLRNVLLLLLVSGGIGWLLDGKLGFQGWQWFAILAGTMLLYKDARLLGMPTTYLVTDDGLGVRLVGGVDYRLFFTYKEIGRARSTTIPKKLPILCDVLSPGKYAREGVLLTSVSGAGFSKQFQGDILLTPLDRETFINHLAAHIPVY